MLDLHAPALPPGLGERLPREVYKRDFRQRDAEIRNGNSWKLERRQHFVEQGSASWEALCRGDWDEALRLFEERRDTLRRSGLDDQQRGSAFHRVRVVEQPLTPYLQWELHSLRQRAQYGERVRVVSAETVAPYEARERLPELTILDERTLYRVLYTEAGVPEGAVRYTDPIVVSDWVTYLRGLHAAGEDVASYVEREVAHLPPPEIIPSRPARSE
ncbi:hypothetical protein OG285_18645 [Streptomyces sp. NBC_01471]|uniref:DUF6879 family protein n=1 Tax=Streptomyces sp. NBC_01471 TaxID=2903879 RepID=UPI0032442F13